MYSLVSSCSQNNVIFINIFMKDLKNQLKILHHYVGLDFFLMA